MMLQNSPSLAAPEAAWTTSSPMGKLTEADAGVPTA